MRHLSRLVCAVLGIALGLPVISGCVVREPEREVYVERRHDRDDHDRDRDRDRDNHPREERREHKENEQH
jgi:hypothetical protein